jgi:DNA-directed RNA polymerase specialized sigma24 family protein
VPDATTRKLFLRRFYEKRKWEEAARLVGLSTGAAKMRYKRYIEQEGTQNAA